MSKYTTDKQNKHFIEPYLRYAERRFIRKKTILFQQDEKGQGFYFLKDGFVKITTTDYKKNTRIIDIPTSGTLIGEQVLNGMPYFSTATVIKDSILYYFSIQTYNNLIQDYPEIENLVVNSIIDKLKLLLSDINVKSIPTENQVAFCLLKLIDIYKDVEIDLTQQELSDYTGLTRITIYKILKKWEEDGILQIKNRKIYIYKPYILKDYID
ncbi:Crp/Fnr family transcriptional regulator [Neobacillus novalis]|uniref:Crp/Fnr family transcriptional regulator n=1 Tax=Neobacillus novalis TaxID=220687 RepID=A0AA95MKV0_9BACI|nr:Crp/Fnr family transcriptional regulator [Neobacillus novalis]WHY85789.1 Crp/Fnr family transcriptional regulator [Neobacillus novalis]